MGKDTFKKFLYTCWKPSVNEEKEDGKLAGKTPDSGGVVNGIWWYKDYGKHVNGEFSMAMVEANAVLEDQCQLESGSLSLTDNGPRGTFVGVYDGHAGYEVARFINNRLFENIKKYTTESQEMSGDVIVNAFLATDDEFISLVESEWKSNPKMASVGSCCLVGIVCNGVLYIANAGDSRAVLAREDKAVNALKAVRVSEEHNASFVSVREELRALHPNDPNIVVLKHNVWRVRGLIQVNFCAIRLGFLNLRGQNSGIRNVYDFLDLRLSSLPLIFFVGFIFRLPQLVRDKGLLNFIIYKLFMLLVGLFGSFLLL
ncbi:probable protein phosphatase 2C 48 isoform X2 [Rutidosis leptorrhynchoides]|uniref:probable protein phosphatase 2C 48 isoform X2 n=1 Tax=Rutidosis leptorrhynchoides TaxID=125765 RepID=UPI003A997870